MTNINVKELITDPDFAQHFSIERSKNGGFVDGLFTSTSTTFGVYGIVQPYQPKTVEYTQNGDQITGDIKIWLLQEIFTTRDDSSDKGISDIIIYKDERYKVTYVKDWIYHGYWSAVAKRISAK